MSEIPVPDKFLKPFYKFHLTQLKQAVRSDSGWSVTIKGGTRLPVFMVWIQGRVKEVNIGEDILVLEEDGAEVTVDTISASPGGVGGLETGQYLQVVGQLVSKDRVRCSKITDLSLNKHCQGMWDLEVSELHSLLSGSIAFSDF